MDVQQLLCGQDKLMDSHEIAYRVHIKAVLEQGVDGLWVEPQIAF